MLGLELVVLVGVALLVCGALAQKLPIAPAISLLAVGVLIGFLPRLREVQLPPEVVLLVFLPALLYRESLTTSLREIRSNLRLGDRRPGLVAPPLPRWHACPGDNPDHPHRHALNTGLAGRLPSPSSVDASRASTERSPCEPSPDHVPA